MTIGNMSRRNFLRAAFAGAAVAATMNPMEALASVFRSNAVTLVRLHDELVAIYPGKDATQVERKVFNSKFNETLAFINDNFETPKKGSENYQNVLNDVKEVFNSRDPNKRTFRDTPPTLAPAAVALSAIRSLLSVHRMRLDPSAMPEFERFADKYQEFILGA